MLSTVCLLLLLLFDVFIATLPVELTNWDKNTRRDTRAHTHTNESKEVSDWINNRKCPALRVLLYSKVAREAR